MIKQYGGASDIEGVPAEMLSYVVRMLLLQCDLSQYTIVRMLLQ